MKRICTAIALAFSLLTSNAKAENVPIQFDSLFQILEGYLFTDNGLPSSVGIGGCTPIVSGGFPSVEMRFTSSATCQLNGYIRINMLPMGANVRLEILNNPNIEAIDADLVMAVKLSGLKKRTLQWRLTNGRVAFRLMPNTALMEWGVTGMGGRIKTKSTLQAASRVNLFDKATGNGRALLRQVSQESGSPKVKSLQSCVLTGAQMDNVLSGTIGECQQIK